MRPRSIHRLILRRTSSSSGSESIPRFATLPTPGFPPDSQGRLRIKWENIWLPAHGSAALLRGLTKTECWGEKDAQQATRVDAADRREVLHWQPAAISKASGEDTRSRASFGSAAFCATEVVLAYLGLFQSAERVLLFHLKNNPVLHQI